MQLSTKIKKTLLESFIKRYLFGSKDDKEQLGSVIWKTEQSKLSTKFSTKADDLLGEIIISGIEDFDNLEDELRLPIYDTNGLTKFISALSEDINILVAGDSKGQGISMKLSDEMISITYGLADMVLFNKTNNWKFPNYDEDVSFVLSEDFINKFTKSLNALTEDDMVCRLCFDTLTSEKYLLLEGDTNKIKINIPANCIVNEKVDVDIRFSSSHFKSILNANKSGRMKLIYMNNSPLIMLECVDSVESCEVFSRYGIGRSL